MDFSLLDNPGWHALDSYHRHLAIRSKIATRYPPDVIMGAAMPHYDAPGFDDLANIVEEGETIALILDRLPPDLRGWEILVHDPLPQMVCEKLHPAAPVNAIELTPEDVPEMMALVALAQPGPFARRTIDLGGYVGIRKDGQLVAMAGQRLYLPGFCEISAVCTHPDHRGRGYGGGLTTLVAQNILARGEIPFLHHAPSNHGAQRLYEKLGFRRRTELAMAAVRRAATN